MGNMGDERLEPELEKELEQRQIRRRRLREERIRKVRRTRALLCLGMLAICILAGVLVADRMKKASSGADGQRIAKVSADAGLVQANGAKNDAGGNESQPGAPDGDNQENQQDQQSQESAAESAAAETKAPKSWEGNLPDVGAIYGIGVNNVGWSHFFADDSYCMAPAGSYVTAFRATVHNQPKDMTGTITYRVNLSGSGWLDWLEDAGEAGDVDGEMPLEAICMELTGELGENYDILYSVLQNQAWTDWVQNGAEAGASGVGLHVSGVRVSIVKKRADAPSYAGNIDPNKPMIALTYDDGPSASATPRILAKLEENGGRATFFMVGKQAERNMGLVKQMVEQGCEVANHTYDHTLMTKVPPDELASQLARTNQVVSDASGVSPILMRPCGGARSDAGMNVVGAISMPAVLWSIDTLDWKTRDAQNTIKVVLESVKDGDIVLMHDLYDATAEASETLIPELTKRGFQLVTVSELASYRGGMLPGHTYSRFRPKTE